MLKLTEAFDMVYREFANYMYKLKKLTPQQHNNILRRLEKAQNRAIRKHYTTKS